MDVCMRVPKINKHIFSQNQGWSVKVSGWLDSSWHFISYMRHVKQPSFRYVNICSFYCRVGQLLCFHICEYRQHVIKQGNRLIWRNIFKLIWKHSIFLSYFPCIFEYLLHAPVMSYSPDTLHKNMNQLLYDCFLVGRSKFQRVFLDA